MVGETDRNSNENEEEGKVDLLTLSQDLTSHRSELVSLKSSDLRANKNHKRKNAFIQD
jgi:hypothetical protein